MKRFSELTSTPTQSTPTNIDDLNIASPEIESQQDIDTITVTPAEKFPDYMVNDSNFVGYESQKFQYTVYRAAEFGTIVTGLENILDVGCGRGDFGDYILSRYPNVKYTGIDLNEIMIQIGEHKYTETYSNFRYNLQAAIFNNYLTVNQKYDYVYHINTLSVDYGLWPNLHSDSNRYEFLKMLIEKSLEISNVGVVFILHNDGLEESGQVSYSLTPLSKILYDMNLKFAIDNTDVPDMYKLVILKNPF